MWLRKGAADAPARFAEFWASDGPRHFAIEEQALTPELLASDSEWSAGVARMAAEHRELERLAAQLAEGDEQAGHVLGERLDAHVRFEERELFPMLEDRADRELLGRVGARIVELRSH